MFPLLKQTLQLLTEKHSESANLRQAAILNFTESRISGQHYFW